MNSKLKITLYLLGLTAGTFALYEGSKKLKKALLEAEKKEKARLEKLEKDKAAFYSEKEEFLQEYTDSHISKVTLSNDKIENNDERAYLYSKMTKLRTDIVDYSYNERIKMFDAQYALDELYKALAELDAESIKAKLIFMHQQDKHQEELLAKINAERDKQIAHERELEILKEKRQSQLDIYNAKIGVEKAKLETLCKAMSGAGNKNISSSINIKTDLKED